jgi:hypothetical protein
MTKTWSSTADVLGSLPELQPIVAPAPDFSAPGEKVLTVKVAGPDAARIAEVIWVALHNSARRLNQHKAPNVVTVEANG